ncbi:glycosyltransferase family 1 protein [Nocardia huaxiensis]|uniref:Glycosyltransferase family 1 protein n=1 Tax=Nocardia huaxiensis TaxID=2755382 RepID=A0A7D6VG15_9NOCA|nr:glycosyltransferase [Nocardia huaxiensis]QLY29296.1 glycosyltransferase family 1 protein [Nocardia huaxiensis]
MRVLLSTIGSRGEVQPMLALALALRGSGAEVRLVAPPDFRELIGEYEIPFAPVGPEVRKIVPQQSTGAQDIVETMRRMIATTVAEQFEAVGAAADGCDVIVACGALQPASSSIAEQRSLPYVYTSFCPVTLPSDDHAPLFMPPIPGQPDVDPTADFRTQWAQDAQRWDARFAEPINAHRVELGLKPITNVRDHIFSAAPLLAADPVLGPWRHTPELEVTHTGAWLVPDDRPLSADLEDFLAAGDPPIYFGFGSMHVPPEFSRTVIDTARALGRRAIVSRGWTDLSLIDAAPDCLSLGEVNQQALFPRLAAIVHHGGAGTTTAAARSGAPQVIVPQRYDQFYWSERIAALGIGAAHPRTAPTVESLTAALEHALSAEVTTAARDLAPRIAADGAAVAAQIVAKRAAAAATR